MEYLTQFVDLQSQPAAVVRGQVTHEGIAEFLGPVFGEVVRVLEDQGLHPAGAPFGAGLGEEERSFLEVESRQSGL